MYIVIESEPGLWTVGFDKPDGRFRPESDHTCNVKAEERMDWLNGDGLGFYVYITSETGPIHYTWTVGSYDDDGKWYVGVDAFLVIWMKLENWFYLGKFVGLPGVKHVAYIFYDMFSRYRFSRLEHCQVALNEDDTSKSRCTIS